MLYCSQVKILNSNSVLNICSQLNLQIVQIQSYWLTNDSENHWNFTLCIYWGIVLLLGGPGAYITKLCHQMIVSNFQIDSSKNCWQFIFQPEVLVYFNVCGVLFYLVVQDKNNRRTCLVKVFLITFVKGEAKTETRQLQMSNLKPQTGYN